MKEAGGTGARPRLRGSHLWRTVVLLQICIGSVNGSTTFAAPPPAAAPPPEASAAPSGGAAPASDWTEKLSATVDRSGHPAPEGNPIMLWPADDSLRVALTLNGRFCWLTLDTGAPMSYIDRENARAIWSPDAGQPLRSNNEPVLLSGKPAYFITGRSIGFYNTDVTLQNVIFLSGNSPAFGSRPHRSDSIGLLGTNVLGRLAVLINAPGEAGRIFTTRLTDKDITALGFSEEHAAPLQRDSLGHYLVSATVDGTPYILRLDTGSQITVLDGVSAAPDLERDVPRKIRTLYGDATVLPAVARDLTLGGWRLRDPVVYRFAAGPKDGQSFANLLGFSTLMRFRQILIDFPNEKVYFGDPIDPGKDSPVFEEHISPELGGGLIKK